MKIWVALSGGVDSSVAALLLIQQGYTDITGVFMKNWSEEFPEDQGMCTWKQDREDAARVAMRLGIKFEMIDFSEEYRKKIVEYFFNEYAAGRTPNPDTLCNKEIKFGLFLEAAQAAGVDMIATGHYARITHENGVSHVYAARDKNKDQSYFLSQVTSRQFDYALFPLGDLTKPEVRAIAEKHNLTTADKKDSQGLCFIGHIDVKQFLTERIPLRPGGQIITTEGRVVGSHDGAEFFTIGQRKGIGLSGGPYYIVEKDIQENKIIVGLEDDPRLSTRSISIDNINMLTDRENLSSNLFVRTRYREPLKKCSVSFDGMRAFIRTEEEIRALTAGQIAVVYDDKEEMLFSGIITGHE